MTEHGYRGRLKSNPDDPENRSLLDLTNGATVYGRTQRLLCKIGMHSIDAVYVWWDVDLGHSDGSKATFISRCRCGKERLLLPNKVPTYLRQRTTKTRT